MVRWLGMAGICLGLSAFVPGCVGHARGTLVYDHEAEYVDEAPVYIERYPSTHYHGRPAYLVDGRWYYQSGRRWVVFHDEPRELRDYRERRAPAYIRKHPVYGDRYDDRRYDNRREQRRYIEERRAAERRAEARRYEERRAAERRAEARRQEERREAARRAEARRMEERRAAERRAQQQRKAQERRGYDSRRREQPRRPNRNDDDDRERRQRWSD